MSKASKKIKIREQKILEFMTDYIKLNCYAPTVREICDSLNISSTSTVHKDIQSLVDQGYLKKDPAKPRAVALVSQLNENRNEEARMRSGDFDTDTLRIPVVGRVAAGQPILAEENIEDYFPIASRYVSGNCYILRVKGESMINAGIMDDDLIIVESCNQADNGDMVVAMVDGFESEATVKTYYREDGHIRLQPENDFMSPIIVDRVQILGKVRGVFRYYS